MTENVKPDICNNLKEQTSGSATEPAEHVYAMPVRCVKTQNEMATWEKSQAYYDIVGFINSISQSIQGRKTTDNLDITPMAEQVLKLFDELAKLLDEIPAIDQPQRFGNKAYRDWLAKLKENAIDYLQSALPASMHRAVPEISVYFTESFGNAIRIDYGTGHELSFIMFLCCLFKIGFLKEEDRVATGLKVWFATFFVVWRNWLWQFAVDI